MRFITKTFLLFIIIGLAGACEQAVEPPPPPPPPPVEYPELFALSLKHDGIEREYNLYIPEGYDENTNWPLVINLHGRGSEMVEQMIYSGFNDLADEHKFMVAYPQGLVATTAGINATHWNADFGTGVDDVGFIDAMIEEIFNDFGLDNSRVYSTGMSNGGFMSYTLACQLSDRIAAIASVAGSMSGLGVQNCNPERQVPVMEFHGTMDEVVPFEGISGGILPVPDVVDFWVNNNGCDNENFIEEELADIDKADSSTVTLYHYNLCDENNEVLLYKINNGGHTWPGSFNIAIFGNTNQDIDASALIWEFFNSYTHPSPRKPNS